MPKYSNTVCWRRTEELLRVPANDVSDDIEWFCFGEWTLDSLSNIDENLVSGSQDTGVC